MDSTVSNPGLIRPACINEIEPNIKIRTIKKSLLSDPNILTVLSPMEMLMNFLSYSFVEFK
jgi:hypothetical protein